MKATFAANLITVSANGVLSVVLARYLLTPDEYGTLFYALSILGVILIFGTLGLPSSVARYITEYTEEDPGQVPHILATSVIILLVFAGTVGVVVSAGSQMIADRLEEPNLAALLTLGFGYIVLQAMRTYLAKVFQGFNRVDYSAIVNAVFATSHVILAIGLVLLGFGVVGAFTGYILGLFVAVVLGSGLLYLNFYRTFDPAEERESGLVRRVAEYSVPLTATKGANVLDKQVDTILVGFLLNPTAVAFYTISKQVSSVCATPAKALGFTVSPAYGEEKAADRVERAAQLYEQSLEHILILYIPAVVGLILVAEPMVRYVFGSDYLGAVPILQVISFYVLVSAINRITSDGLDFLGRARDRAIIKTTTAVSNFILNLLLIPIFGVVGAAVATVITFSVYTGMNVYIIASELPIRFAAITRTVVGTSLVAVLMGVGVYLVLPFVSGPVTLFGVVGFGVVIWLIGASISGLFDVRRTVNFFA